MRPSRKGFTFGPVTENKQIAISVQGLHVTFGGIQPYQAVQDVSFSIAAGHTLALIGASGSGKSVTSLALMGLLPANAAVSGRVSMPSAPDLLATGPAGWTHIRGQHIGMVFQEPMSALNPVKSCGYQLVESIRAHRSLSTKEAKQLALQWLEKVKLPEPARLFKRFPHQLSGGQKQRVMIAMAMCNHPTLLIADEPTTALDVTVQKEIISLMKSLQQEYGTAILFITHDLALARTIADDYLVMDKGRVVENGFSPGTQAMLRPTEEPRQQPLLVVDNLKIWYPAESGLPGKTTGHFKAVDGVSFELYQGETLGLVGESGCGKSTLGRSLIGLQPVTAGNIYFEGQDITGFDAARWRRLRKDIQIIFQDPYASLNQRMRIGDALAEPMLVHGLAGRRNVYKHVEELLEMVGMPAASLQKYPHEFSGGQRQRICIARALAVQPRLIICDESVSALDIRIQEQVLELLAGLQQQKRLSYLFITHDLNVVRRISNRIMVMEKGHIVEQGPAEEIMQHPAQPYTKRLLAAIPGL